MKPAVKAVLAAFSAITLLAGIALGVDSLSNPDTVAAAGSTQADDGGASGSITAGTLYAASFHDLDGNTLTLGRWHDRLLVVNFWATWCAPCKEEMPIFSAVQARHRENGLQVVGIAADSAANVAKFQKNTPVDYLLLPDEMGAIKLSKRLGNRFGLLPHTVIFAPGGRQVYAKLGVVTESELEAIVVKNMPKIR